MPRPPFNSPRINALLSELRGRATLAKCQVDARLAAYVGDNATLCDPSLEELSLLEIQREVIRALLGDDAPLFHDAFNTADTSIHKCAQSVCAIVNRNDLDEITGDNGRRWAARFDTLANAQSFCDNEQYSDDCVLKGFICTGFLIAPGLVATARHVPLHSDRSSDYLCIFDFAHRDSGTAPRTYSDEQAYLVAEIRQADPRTNDDWALLRLERNPGREALRHARTITTGDTVCILGHPLGLPMKCTTGHVTAVSERFCHFNALSYSGMSGGPVLVGRQVVAINGIGGTPLSSDEVSGCRRWMSWDGFSDPKRAIRDLDSVAWRIAGLDQLLDEPARIRSSVQAFIVTGVSPSNGSPYEVRKGEEILLTDNDHTVVWLLTWCPSSIPRFCWTSYEVAPSERWHIRQKPEHDDRRVIEMVVE